MSDIFGTALIEAVNHDTILRASELDVNMIVRHIQGVKHWTVTEFHFPEGFPELVIIRLQDSNGYDDTLVYRPFDGKNDEAQWLFIGWREVGWMTKNGGRR